MMIDTARGTGHIDPAAPGRPLPLRPARRLMLAGMLVLLVFGSEPLRAFMTYLPLWMAPVDFWLMDATAAWHGWMVAIGASAPYEWIHDAVEELRILGAPG